MRLCHGDFRTNQIFDHFINETNTYLSEHQSEFVLFRLKVERPRIGNITDRLAFQLFMSNDIANRIIRIPNFNVTVDQIRGKIILLSDNHDFHNFGFRYSDCIIQDYFNLNDFWDLYDKVIHISFNSLFFHFHTYIF